MSQNIAIQSLVTEREKIVAEKNSAISRFDEQIQKLETAIEQLSGKKVWEVQAETAYNDEHPDYIRSSQEEI